MFSPIEPWAWVIILSSDSSSICLIRVSSRYFILLIEAIVKNVLSLTSLFVHLSFVHVKASDFSLQLIFIQSIDSNICQHYEFLEKCLGLLMCNIIYLSYIISANNYTVTTTLAVWIPSVIFYFSLAITSVNIMNRYRGPEQPSPVSCFSIIALKFSLFN